MKPDPKLPDRFAKLVLSELADMHALLLCIADSQISEAAKHAEATVSADAQQRIKKSFDSKRAVHAERIYAELLRKLRLND